MTEKPVHITGYKEDIMSKDSYDLIVVGAGSGGCATAKVAAEQGLKVLLIDKRKKEEIGDKLTFDTILPNAFTTLGIPFPEGKEFDMKMTKLRVFSPNRRYFFDAFIDATLTHRHLLGQRLLKCALDAGTELMPDVDVTGPVIKDGFVVGVQYKASDGNTAEVRAKVVCDSSGIRAVVRDKLPKEIYNGEKLVREDTVVTYREVRDLLGTCFHSPDHDFPGWYCTLQNHGYFWVVPENKTQANIGCGIPMFADNPTPEKLTEDYLNETEHIALYGKTAYAKGTGPTPRIPMRADQPILVANGLVLVGEAGWQVATNSGFGVQGSIVAGKLAAETIADAIRNGDVSKKGLWKYNVAWKREQGAIRAFADGIRFLVQSFTHDELNILIRTKVLGGQEFGNLWSDRTFRYSFKDMVVKFFCGIGHIPLLLKLFSAYRLCVKLEEIYRAFPDTVEGFEAWNDKRKATYKELFQVANIKRELSA